jgi:hypothetical protein
MLAANTVHERHAPSRVKYGRLSEYTRSKNVGRFGNQPELFTSESSLSAYGCTLCVFEGKRLLPSLRYRTELRSIWGALRPAR